MFNFLIKFLLSRKRKFNYYLILTTTYFIPFLAFPQAENGYKLKTIVIDAGHGGKDFGAVGAIGREKDIVLNIALKTGKYIEQNVPGVKVIYTRKTDVFIPLHERAEIANKNNADLFISIHANSNPSSKPYGTETYAMGLHKSDDNLQVAQLENSAILQEENYMENYEGFDPNSAESYIIFNLFQNIYLEQSIDFASYVQNEFREKAKRRDRGVKQAGFLVLWKTTMPSVLIETGFISNSKEEKYLLTDEGQSYLASAIYRAFRDYKKWYDETNIVQEDLAQKNINDIINQEKNIINVVDSKDIENEKTNKTSAIDDQIYFKIQISSASKRIPLNSDFFKGHQDVQEIEYYGLYKYAVGNETDFNEVIKLKEKIKSEYPDAFIIALKGGKIIPLNKALLEIKKNN